MDKNIFSTLGLAPYKTMKLDSMNKLDFFLKKHSTQEGTWAGLHMDEGEIDFVFLKGDGQPLSSHRINTNQAEFLIPPSAWHQIKRISKTFSATLVFYCKPHRYFSKKHRLNPVHGDLLYAYRNYLQGLGELNILDIGCGSGRNLLFLAKEGHPVAGIDQNEAQINNIKMIAEKENLNKVQTQVHDLNTPLTLQKESYDLIISTVTLQFLKAERIPALLGELQEATALKGFHFLVYPVKAEPYALPSSFTYLADKDALYHFYQDAGWAVWEYKESVGQLHRLDETNKPIQGLFALLLAQKI